MNKVIDLSDRSKMFYWQSDRNLDSPEITKIFVQRHAKISSETAKRMIEFALKKSGYLQDSAKVIEIDGPMKSGSINSSFCATTKAGEEFMIRIHPKELKNGYFWAERMIAQEVTENGVRTYRPIFVYDERKEFDHDFILMSKVSGEVMKSIWPIDDNLDKDLVRDIGRQIALIQKSRTSGFGFFDNKLAKSGTLRGIHKTFKDFFYTALDENLKYLVEKEVISGQDGKNVESVFLKNEDLLKIDTPTIIHNDIADWNVLVDTEKRVVTGMMDWDETVSGDPVMEFAQWRLFFSDERTENLVKGYTEILDLPEGYTEKFPLFTLRYNISKMVLRQRRVGSETDQARIDHLNQRIVHAKVTLEELFGHYRV